MDDPKESYSFEVSSSHPDLPVLAEIVPGDPTPLRRVPVRRKRRAALPVALFTATCLSTWLVGTTGFTPGGFGRVVDLLLAGEFGALWAITQQGWVDGLIYMGAVMGILLAHEMGHFLQAMRYHVPASLPFFIPMPFTQLGTMGAVIGMEKSTADRRQLFDIGLTGPLAGLVIAIPVIWAAIYQADIVDPARPLAPGEIRYGQPLIIKLLVPVVKPGIEYGAEPDMTPLLMAGWVGMLITGLNMFPLSQLDGGHVIYALFGSASRVIVRVVLFGCILCVVFFNLYVWTVMLVVVTLIGIDHPQTANDRAPLGPLRWIIGLASLVIPVLCFVPNPFPGM